jgi:hypothetical protein
MSRSIVPVTPGDLSFNHGLSGSKLTIRGGLHRVERNGLSAEYPAAFGIGSGKVGSSFAVRIGDRLFQSPISWFAQSRQFLLSPGFEKEKHPDFDRPIRDECLFCHTSGGVAAPAPIGCERCHGDSAIHISKPKLGNIINPAKLRGADRDGVCEQCHLSGVARIPHPGKRWQDFRPGQPTSSVWTTFVSDGDFRVVSHTEQLASSLCIKNGKLWCGTCHDPHPVKAARSIDSVCQDCHKPHDGGTSRCDSCHMPKRAVTDVVHTSYTDHRIQKPRSRAASSSDLRMWAQPPKEFVERAWALARLESAAFARDVSGLERLARDLERIPPDAAVWKARGAVALQRAVHREAESCFAKATELEPSDASAWLSLGVARRGLSKTDDATKALRRATEIDPYLLDAYIAEAVIHRNRGDEKAYRATLQRYLQVVPKSLSVREALRKNR